MGQQRSTGCKKKTFFKMILEHMECQNKCFWRVLSSWCPFVALPKSGNAPKTGCFCRKKGSKMGQKCVFPRMMLDHLGCLHKCNGSFLSPLQHILGPPKSHNALKMGSFGTRNKSKMHPTCGFPKVLLDYLGCTDKWNKPILGPYWAILAPLKAERGFKMDQLGCANGSKTGQNHVFQK